MEKKKTAPKGKVENYFNETSFDYASEKSADDPAMTRKLRPTKSDAEQMRDEVATVYPNQFRGKVMRMFNLTETKEMMKAQQIQEEPIPEYTAKAYNYIQMRLNIENLSEEFHNELEEYRLSGIQIRKAQQEDLATIVKLYNRAFMKGSDPWSPATDGQFQEILNHDNTVILIGKSQGEDIGFIITDLEGDNNEVGVICGLGTDPRWQRKGIGRYLGIASWDYFQKMNVKELRCEVYEENQASYRLIKGLHFQKYGSKTYHF